MLSNIMPDRLTQEDRSRLMSKVKSEDTKPEKLVRSMLHKMGYRFRLHRQDLPGSPDIVLPKYKKVVFVHGCFWHSHDCQNGKRPNSRTEFWNNKLDKNLERDYKNKNDLEDLGWEVLVVWECELKQPKKVRKNLKYFLEK